MWLLPWLLPWLSLFTLIANLPWLLLFTLLADFLEDDLEWLDASVGDARSPGPGKPVGNVIRSVLGVEPLAPKKIWRRVT